MPTKNSITRFVRKNRKEHTMKRHFLLTGTAIAMMAFSACNDETLDLGNTLTGPADKLTTSSADYQVSTHTIMADSVLIKSSYCCIGNLKDSETGTYVKSDFMTQLNIQESFSLPDESTILNKYDGRACVDSCQLLFILKAPTAVSDTLAAMKMRIWELSSPMEEDKYYYSNYDPIKEGLIQEGAFYEDKVFSHYDLSEDDESIRHQYPFVSIRLDKPYTDKNGVTYKNYGTYIMHQYYDHPEYFKNSYSFIHNVCPGFYMTVTDGEGLYTEVSYAGLQMVYDKVVTEDSTHTDIQTLAGTSEVLQTTTITNDKVRLQQLADDNTCTYLKAPAGLFTEVTLPVDDIFNNHQEDSIMTASINFQRINNLQYDKEQQIPTYLLMVPKDSLYTFFEKSRTPDNLTSFYTGYMSGKNYYSFSNISSLVTKMHNQKNAGLLKEANWLEKNPNWNKVVLVPIKINSTTTSSNSSMVTGYENMLTIASTRLVGGSQNPYSAPYINIVYGKFNQ